MQEDYVQGLRPSNTGFIDSFRTSHYYSEFMSDKSTIPDFMVFKVEFGAMPGHKAGRSIRTSGAFLFVSEHIR